jgi:hypothetical protein
LGKVAAAALGFVLLAGTVWLFGDYMRLNRLIFIVDLYTNKETGRQLSSSLVDEANGDVKIFRQFADHVTSSLVNPEAHDLAVSARFFDRILHKIPTAETIYRRVIIAAYMNDRESARLHLQRLFMFYPGRQQMMAESYRNIIAAHPRQLGMLTLLIEEELARAPQSRW